MSKSCKPCIENRKSCKPKSWLMKWCGGGRSPIVSKKVGSTLHIDGDRVGIGGGMRCTYTHGHSRNSYSYSYSNICDS